MWRGGRNRRNPKDGRVRKSRDRKWTGDIILPDTAFRFYPKYRKKGPGACNGCLLLFTVVKTHA